jgi:hypothetical protein
MAEDTRTFSNIDRAKVDKLKSAVAAFVELPAGDSGTIESHGMKGSYVYDEAAQTLTLGISESPLFVPRAMIWSTIERTLNE